MAQLSERLGCFDFVSHPRPETSFSRHNRHCWSVLSRNTTKAALHIFCAAAVKCFPTVSVSHAAFVLCVALNPQSISAIRPRSPALCLAVSLLFCSKLVCAGCLPDEASAEPRAVWPRRSARSTLAQSHRYSARHWCVSRAVQLVTGPPLKREALHV